jgi:hypothetical protein
MCDSAVTWPNAIGSTRPCASVYLPKEAEGSDALESVLRAANENLATLAPNVRFFVAEDSGHDTHQDQPELVIEAIRQVVVGVRHPATWNDLRLVARNRHFTQPEPTR